MIKRKGSSISGGSHSTRSEFASRDMDCVIEFAKARSTPTSPLFVIYNSATHLYSIEFEGFFRGEPCWIIRGEAEVSYWTGSATTARKSHEPS